MTVRRLDNPHNQAGAVLTGGDTAGALTFRDWLLVLISATAGGVLAAVLVPHWLTELSHTLMGQKPRVFWYLGRASAFVSFLLLWLSMMLGLMMSSKLARAWPGGAVAQDLHQSASLMGLVFGVFHAFILMGSRFLNYDVLDVLVPFRSDAYRTMWVGMGQIAIYGMAAVGLSFYVRRKITQRFWRLIHFLSFAVFALVLAHGLQAGSDADTPVVKALYWVTAGSVLCLTVHRVLSRLADRAAGSGQSFASAGGTAAPPVQVAPSDAHSDTHPSTPAPMPAGAPVTILFGSQSGNAEMLARRAADALATAGMPAVALDAARFQPDQLAQTQRLIIITSTCGEGEPPDNIAGLHRHLHAGAASSLAHLEYGVLALGDSSYATFCKAGRDFDARLAALGARRLCDLVACDTDYEPSYQAWIARAIQAFRTRPAQDATPAMTPRVTPVAAPTERRGAVSEAMPASGEQEPYSRTRPFMAQIVRNESLHAGINLTGRQTRHVVFSLRGSGLTYEPGDALGVWPANRLSLVAEVIRAAGLPKDAVVKLPDGGHAPLVDALLRHYDISRLTRAHVECFAERSRDPALQRLLDGTGAGAGADALKEYCRGRDLIDLLQDHPRLFGNAGEFVAMLRKLNPRLYSISSSQKMCPDEVHLTVGVLRYDSNGRRRYGVCSNDLAQARHHATRPIFVQPNKTFRLPADARTPVIMVGPGTGIAPFRSFLQERAAAGARGKNWLFFGCQHARSDFLYREELELFRARGVLVRLDTAFSRDQAEKIYVQNLINQNATELWRWLDEGAYFYVCGDAARMAKDVDEALHDVAIQAGGLSAEKAREWAATLRQQKRYLRDVY